MNAPQIIAIILFTMVFMLNVLKHGQPREGNYSALTGVMFPAIWGGLMYWGGFFG